jgi:alpha 1,2-mannosyltransferase
MVIDKRRHLDALYLAHFMLLDWEFWYHFSDGDKDTFRFAFLALAKRWPVPGRYVSAGALPSGTQSGELCSHTMLQNDHNGEPLCELPQYF